jgi:hypothetical protein
MSFKSIPNFAQKMNQLHYDAYPANLHIAYLCVIVLSFQFKRSKYYLARFFLACRARPFLRLAAVKRQQALGLHRKIKSLYLAS